MDIYAVDYPLYPPHYDPKRHDASNDPEFAYTSVEMQRIEESLADLRNDLWAYLNRLFGHHFEARLAELLGPSPEQNRD